MQGDDNGPRRGGDGGGPKLLRRLNISTANSKLRMEADGWFDGDGFDDGFNGGDFDGDGLDLYRVGDEGSQTGDSFCCVGNGE